MYSKNSFGSFYPVDSALHRLNPIVKILNFVIAVVILIISSNLQVNLFLLGLVIIMCLLSFVPTKFYFNSFYSLRYIFIFIIILCYFFGLSLETACVYIIKVVVVVEYLFVIIYTTSPSELNYGIEKLLNVFNILGLNMARVAVKVTNILRFIPLLITIENKILKSGSSRGIDYNNSDIIGRGYAVMKAYTNALRLSLKKSKDIKRNEEIKLFDIRKHRTNYRTNRVGFYDLMFFLFHVCIIISVLVERGVLNEILTKFNL